MSTFVTHIGWAKTSDGFVFYEQPDGSYTDGDLYFANVSDLMANTDAVVFGAPLFRIEKNPD